MTDKQASWNSPCCRKCEQLWL